MSSILAEFLRSLLRAPRTLVRTPAISIASVVTLAIAMGATTAIFSVVYGVVLRPLPFRDPATLVQVNAQAEDGRLLGVSQVELDDWLAQSSAFESIAVYTPNHFTLAGFGDPELLRGAVVSKQFFPMLSVQMRLGRGLSDDDDRAAHVVLGESLWRTRFSADRSILGRTISLNGRPYTVIGVAPTSFRFPADDVALWTGLGYALTTAPPQWSMRGFRQFTMVARLRDAQALAAARSEASAIAVWLARTYPRFSTKVGAVVAPLQERLVGSVRQALIMLFAAVGLVLLVACGNIANLSFARAADRQREMAIRTATGASQGQLVAHALAESVVVALAGAMLGLVMAKLSLTAMLTFMPPDAPRTAEIRLDVVSIVFTAGMTLLSVMVFGVWPAVWAARQPTNYARRQVRHSPGRLAIFRDGLVVAELSLAVILLIGSALLGRSLHNLLESGTGVEHADALTMKLNFSAEAARSAAAQAALADRLLAAVRATPGIQAVGLTSSLPPNVSQMRPSLPVVDAAGSVQELSFEIVAAGGEVFSALGIPILAGRRFSESDTAESPPVVILSKSASERFFPHGDAVGRALPAFATSVGQSAPIVVGTVGDVKFAGLDAPPDGAIYVPHTQRSFRTQYLVVRTGAGSSAPVAALRAAIRAVDPSLALSDIRSVSALVTAATARPRFHTSMLVLLAVFAMSLAAVGLYGVVAHVVGQRTPELAVRMALGATPSEVLRMIMAKALVLSALGSAIGVALSYASARAIESFLYGVRPLDWPSFAASALLAVVIGAVAALLPALRATKVQPAAILRAS